MATIFAMEYLKGQRGCEEGTKCSRLYSVWMILRSRKSQSSPTTQTTRLESYEAHAAGQAGSMGPWTRPGKWWADNPFPGDTCWQKEDNIHSRGWQVPMWCSVQQRLSNRPQKHIYLNFCHLCIAGSSKGIRIAQTLWPHFCVWHY